MKTFKSLSNQVQGIKSAVMTFGRMNPPTRAHARICEEVVSIAKDIEATPFIFLSPSQDTKKNPLYFEEKIRYLDLALYENVSCAIYRHSSVKTPFDAFRTLSSQGYNHLVVVVGSDRVQEFEKKLAAYNGKEFYFESIDVRSIGTRDPDSLSWSGDSSTFLRECAIKSNFSSFREKVIPGIADNFKKEMFELIQSRIGSFKGTLNESPLRWSKSSNSQYSAIFNVYGAEVEIKFTHQSHKDTWRVSMNLSEFFALDPRTIKKAQGDVLINIQKILSGFLSEKNPKFLELEYSIVLENDTTRDHLKSILRQIAVNNRYWLTMAQMPSKVVFLLKRRELNENIITLSPDGYEREQLPQIPQDQLDNFVEFLATRGISSLKTELRISEILPSQASINMNRVGEKMDAILSNELNPEDFTLIVSADYRLLDGHHLWAALHEYNPSQVMTVIIVNLLIDELVQTGNSFPNSFKKSISNQIIGG